MLTFYCICFEVFRGDPIHISISTREVCCAGSLENTKYKYTAVHRSAISEQ